MADQETVKCFDMPSSGNWERRGGWIATNLAADLRFTLEQAAGLTGNLGYETGGLKHLQELRPKVAGSLGGLGWAQWTGMHPRTGRRYAFVSYCSQLGLSPASDEGNYRFLVHELRTTYAHFAVRLRKANTIEYACHLTHRFYETPADVLDGTFRSGPDRLHYARQALAGALQHA